MPRYFTRLILSALLLFAQHEALSHQVWHLQNGHVRQSLHQEGGKQTSAPGLCVFHLAFGTVLGAIGSASLPPTFAANTVERNLVFAAHNSPQFSVLPASRGPPILC
jgi:hypothetical protein